MSLSAAAMRMLAEKGLTLDEVIAVAEANEIAAPADDPSKAAKSARNKRYYQSKRQNKTTEKRLKTTESDATEKRLKTTESVLIQTPLARVLDNNPLTEDYNLTLPDEREAEIGWPESDPPSRTDLDRLECALRAAAGPALHAVSTKLLDLSPILRLARQGQGPPCDLQADVLPIIRARSAKVAPGSVKGWDYFTEAICEARNRRLSGSPALQLVKPNERHDAPPNRRQAAFTERLQDIGSALAAS